MKLSLWTSKHLDGLVFAILALLTFAGNMPACYERFQVACDTASSWEGKPINTGIQLLDERRLCIRENLPAGETLYLYAPSAKGLPSTLRSLHLGLTWETLPQKVIISDTNELALARYITTSLYEGGCPVTNRDCVCIGTKGNSAALWAHGVDVPKRSPAKRLTPSWWREVAGVMALLVFITLCSFMGGWLGLGTGLLFFSVGMAVPALVGFSPGLLYVFAAYASTILSIYWLFRENRWLLTRIGLYVNGTLALATGLLLFIGYSILTLTHTFVAPNGLGVYGGKAKLLYLAAGFPADFFTSSAWATLQPAYPPGFAFVTLGCYGVAGECGEWLTQLLSCVFMSLSAVYLVQQGKVFSNALGRRLFFLGCVLLGHVGLFLGASPIWMTTLYYAEPLMLLFLLIGADAVLRSRYPVFGWVLVGSCGWVKTEGVVLFLALWLAFRLVDGRRKAPVNALLLGLVLPLAWFVYSRGQGATLYDYAPLWAPDPERMGKAAVSFIKLAFFEPWRYGFAYPLACQVMFVPRWRTSTLLAGTLMMFLCVGAFIWIFGMSRTPDMDWHLISMERLLFAPALLWIFIFAEKFSHGDSLKK
jgi:hypothetical protein